MHAGRCECKSTYVCAYTRSFVRARVRACTCTCLCIDMHVRVGIREFRYGGCLKRNHVVSMLETASKIRSSINQLKVSKTDH